MKVKYQVFVSSTYEDLKEERKEVSQAILESHCIPAGMELFAASNKGQWEIIKKVIDDSDFYLLIIAGRYGSLGIDDEGNRISYTEMEFNYAFNTGKPILALLYDNIDSLPRGKSEISATKVNKLKKFRQKACNGRVIKKWDNKDNLKAAVLAALAELKDNTDAAGWIRADFKPEQQSYAFLEQQRIKYETKIETLQKSLHNKEQEIKDQNTTICMLDNQINQLQNRWNTLTEKQADFDDFWFQILQLSLSYEYLMDKDGNVIDDLLTERTLTCPQNFFLSHHGDKTLWQSIIKKSKQILAEYRTMSQLERENFIKSTSFAYEEIFDDIDDVYVISDDELVEPLGLAFFFLQIYIIDKFSSLRNLLLEKKNQVLSTCNKMIEEIWEAELCYWR